MDVSVRFIMSNQDKAMLDAIVRADGDAPMSAVLRRLIRDEAQRRGIKLVDPEPEQTEVKDGMVA
jgi:hypothetical protein